MIKLIYLNNVMRKQVAQLEAEQFSAACNITEAILQCYQNHGYLTATEATHLYVMENNSISTFNENELCDTACEVTIIYSDIVALNNAGEFYRKNGIVYYFHTSEKGHMNYPHIHAKYAGKGISIYYKFNEKNPIRVVGKFSNKAKKKEAVEFVKEHIEEIDKEWTRIIEEQI